MYWQLFDECYKPTNLGICTISIICIIHVICIIVVSIYLTYMYPANICPFTYICHLFILYINIHMFQFLHNTWSFLPNSSDCYRYGYQGLPHCPLLFSSCLCCSGLEYWSALTSILQLSQLLLFILIWVFLAVTLLL